MHHLAHSNLCKAETLADAKQKVRKSLMKEDLTHTFNSKKEVDKYIIWIELIWIALLSNIINKGHLMSIYQNLDPY